MLPFVYFRGMNFSITGTKYRLLDPSSLLTKNQASQSRKGPVLGIFNRTNQLYEFTIFHIKVPFFLSPQSHPSDSSRPGSLSVIRKLSCLTDP